MIDRRTLLATGAAAALAAPAIARAAKPPLKIGNTMPYSGPASSYGVIGHSETAYFHMMNLAGGIAGRQIDFISLDDGYSPPRTVEDVRRLLDADHVDFMFQNLGTPTNSAIAALLNHRQVPQLFVGSGASKWADYKKYPWTMGWQPDYRT